jgi:lysophospholipase L1-like esterase
MGCSPTRAKARGLLFCTLIALTLAGGCSPTAPTPPPPPPPPPPEAPVLSCNEDVARGTINSDGLAVTFPTPEATKGQAPVNVACSPESGSLFPFGQTAVTCTATDALARTATCEFRVTVTKLPQLSRLRFMAFGDSITAGEVTFPGSTAGLTSGKQVVVPAAAYPTVLERLLRARYQFQGDQIFVFNQGVSGEKAIDARNRYFSALAGLRPDVVLILSGTNDIPLGADGAASGAANEVRIFAQEAKLRGMRVFIATPVPGRPGGNRTINTFLLVDYANRMRDMAAREGAVLVDLYAAMLPDVHRYIGVDGLHPNEAGYARMAELFFQAIQANLEVR